MKRIVYAVSSGSHSDYSVAVLFTTQELAEAFCTRENSKANRAHDDYSVEEFELRDELPGEAVTAWSTFAQVENGHVKYRRDAEPFERNAWGNSDFGLTVDSFGATATAPTREEAERLLGEWVEEQMRLVPKLPTVSAAIKFMARDPQSGPIDQIEPNP